APLARSPGCRDVWIAEFHSACQAMGEPPAGVPEAAGLFARRLPSGVWVVVGMSPQGADDRGRPGALAFHGLFLSPRAFRRLGADPFALTHVLRSDWSASDTSLTAGVVSVPRPESSGEAATSDPRVDRIVDALVHRRRALMESVGPIDDLAREVWRRLPVRQRLRKSVATWAFRNTQRFDLVAVPRLSGIALDDSYLPPEAFASLEAGRTGVIVPSPGETNPIALVTFLSLALGLIVLTVVILFRRGEGSGEESPKPVPTVTVEAPRSAPPVVVGCPTRDAFPTAPGDDDPTERRRVAEVFIDLSDRCGVAVEPGESSDPATLMERLAVDLRYAGPLLSVEERAALIAANHPDAALALDWDRIVRRFVGDRPLPEDFRDGPLRWQLGVLGWSWHLGPLGDDRPGRSVSERSQELAEQVAVGVSLRTTVLTERYEALAAYHAFLGRLPRR
ncbi:MAG: hypothetical protein AB7I30_04020, partial [Isosphaeraceae bacterium]